MSSRLWRPLGTIALVPLFGLMFWAAATVASSIPGLTILGVDVHGLGLASYAGDSAQRPAPLSPQLLEDAQRDAGSRGAVAFVPATPGPVHSNPGQPAPSASPRPTPSPTPKATPRPTSTPLPTPIPVPSLPLPTPTPAPLPSPTPLPTPPLPAAPTPTPTPGLLPLPLPVPILPSLLPGLLK